MTPPQWPSVPASKGIYESFYLRAADPASPRAVWIRYTVHKRPGREPLGSLWFTLFDDGVHATKQTFPDPAPGDWIEVGGARYGPDRATGEMDTAAWELAIHPRAEILHHLPRSWMYRAPVPRTKPESPYPDASFDGTLTAGGRSLEVSGWRGMCGHNWGTEHAARWIWVHGVAFEQDASAWLDLTVARVKIGPVTTPWIANGALEVAGERVRLGGLERTRATEVEADAQHARLRIPGRGMNVFARIAAKDLVAWRYAGPDLDERHSAHSSNAALTLRVERRGAAPLELTTPHAAAYELGLEPRGHGDLHVQPAPDGVL